MAWCRVLHSALIHDEPVYAEALIRRLEQIGLINDVIHMRNHLQQVLSLAYCLQGTEKKQQSG